MAIADSLSFTLGLDTGPFDRALRGVPSKVDRAAKLAEKAFLATAAAIGAASSALVGLGASAVQQAAKFETLESRLATVLGGAGEGRRRLDELFSVASSTPFNLDQLVAADAVLESYGQNAGDLRTAVMDLSGALGMDLEQSAQAVGKALTAGAGSADLLRERGVLAMVETRTGMKATEMSAAEFREALIETLTDPDGKIAGGTERMAKTFAGLVSNLQDEWTKFQMAVASEGTFDAAKAAARGLLQLIEDNRAVINEVAATVGTGLVAALQTAVYTAGLLVDGMDLVDMAIQGAKMGVAAVPLAFGEATASMRELAAEALGLLGDMAEFAGLGHVAAKFEEMEESRRRAAEEVRGYAREIAADLGGFEAAEKYRELADNLGRGARWADSINKSLLEHRGGTQVLPKAESEGGGGGGGGKGAIEDETVAIDEQAIALAELAEIRAQVAEQRQADIFAAMTEEEQIKATASAELEKIKAIADARAEDQMVQEESMRAMAEVELDTIERIRAARERAAAEEEEARRKRNQDIAASSSQLAGALADTFSMAYENAAKSGSKSADKLYKVFKALSFAQITADYAVAIMRAASATALNPAAGAIAGIAATVGYANSVARLAMAKPPQTFDIGGTVLPGVSAYTPMAQTPDQVDVRALPGESVVDRQTTQELGGADGVRAALEGGGTSTTRIEVQFSGRARRMLKQSRRSGAVGQR